MLIIFKSLFLVLHQNKWRRRQCQQTTRLVQTLQMLLEFKEQQRQQSPSVVSLKYINLWGSLLGKTMRCHPLSWRWWQRSWMCSSASVFSLLAFPAPCSPRLCSACSLSAAQLWVSMVTGQLIRAMMFLSGAAAWTSTWLVHAHPGLGPHAGTHVHRVVYGEMFRSTQATKQ